MPVISFQNVSKAFPRHAGQMLLRDRVARLFRPSPKEPFYALRDVTFQVEQGERLGVIGHNGAGKSTMLNIATGLCSPTAGVVQVNGRVAALLELGSGFHADLTGAENVRINSALMGLNRRESRARFEEIVDFSGIREFIDEPLRTYSSGMTMRLAFSVAVNVDPDILIIDEVLGVGDHTFFKKCLDRIMQFQRSGKTILCVSHSLATLEQLCSRAIWLDHGRLVETGPVKQLIEAYTEKQSAPVGAL
jgi:ABC-type polysaccharide/polyol phosphate transport system ATPase subunit